MLISLIISTKSRSPESLEPTLFSLVKTGFSNAEVIIVDQNDDKRMESLVSSCNSKSIGLTFVYISAPGTGLSRGRNTGARSAKGEWLWFFDDDAKLDPGLAAELESTLTENIGKELVYYGRVLTDPDRRNYLSRAIITPRLHAWNFDSVSSIALIFSRAAWNRVGSFNENFGVGARYGAGEESDVVIRLMNVGVPIVYVNKLIALHPAAEVDPEKAGRYGEGLGALYRATMFQSLSWFIVFFLKIVVEFVGRLLLSLVNVLEEDRGRIKAHLSYMRGFITGFRAYESTHRQ